MGTEIFSSTLDLLIGFDVNLYVGEEVYKGKLIGVEPDHVILENENNYIFYYSLDQIQAITKNTKQFQGEETEAEFLKTQSLTEVLTSLKQSWVTILCLNKRKFNGVLSHVDADYATLISGEERILIKLTHISNILKGYIQENENSNSNESESQDNTKAEENKNEEAEDVTPRMTNKESVKKSESSSKVYKVEKQSEASKVYKAEQQSEASSSKETKAEKKSEENVKVISEEKEQQTKVWSQSIKNVTQKLNEVTTQKINNEMRKPKEEQVQNSKKQEKPRAVENSSPQINEEKPASQKVAKEVQVTQKQEHIAPVYKSKEIVAVTKKAAEEKKNETVQNKKAAEEKKNETVQNKKDETRKVEQPVRGFRFAGEPVTPREMERTSFFSGWPNRSNKSRF